MALVAGVDSSTQSTKVVVRDAETGELVRQGQAPHPPGTEVDPQAWWQAFQTASEGPLDDVAAIGVAGQQHGMVTVDAERRVVRPALLWNDVRSAGAARDLVDELGGPQAWADAVGTVPVASITATKLRWLAEHEPDNAARMAAVMLPHDYLAWQLAGKPRWARVSRSNSCAFSSCAAWLPGRRHRHGAQPAHGRPRQPRCGPEHRAGPGGFPGPGRTRRVAAARPPGLGLPRAARPGLGRDRVAACRADNEANLSALGEMWFGVARGLRHFVRVFGEIGVGGGVVLDGRLFRGAYGHAGEVGHVPIDRPAP